MPKEDFQTLKEFSKLSHRYKQGEIDFQADFKQPANDKKTLSDGKTKAAKLNLVRIL